MEQYSFFNSNDGDRKYNARHWADYFAPLFTNGVFNGHLKVVANNNMTVTVNEGYSWINGYAYHLTEPLVLDLETASGNMNRKDNIVLRLDLSNRYIRAFAVAGTYYAGEAQAPGPERTSTVHEIVIARIDIPAGTTEITQAMITDTRMDTELCGWVCGAVDQIEFSQILAQLDLFKEEKEAEFEEWFEEMKGQLSEDAAGHLQQQIDNIPITHVVNTNTTTEAGKALDARQANPDIEGTMAGQIVELNQSLEYNLTETLIGTFLGQPLYRKCIPIVITSAATQCFFNHGVDGSKIKKIDGYISDGSFVLPLNYSSQSSVYTYTSQTQIVVTTITSRNGYSGYVYIEYTK